MILSSERSVAASSAQAAGWRAELPLPADTERPAAPPSEEQSGGGRSDHHTAMPLLVPGESRQLPQGSTSKNKLNVRRGYADPKSRSARRGPLWGAVVIVISRPLQASWQNPRADRARLSRRCRPRSKSAGGACARRSARSVSAVGDMLRRIARGSAALLIRVGTRAAVPEPRLGIRRSQRRTPQPAARHSIGRPRER